MNKKFHIFLEGGLGNRIRVINSILNLLEANKIDNYSVTIFWIIAADLNASYEDLFEGIDQVHVVNVQKGSLKYLYLKTRFNVIFPWLKYWIPAYKGLRDGNLILSGKNAAKTYISTWHQFYPIRKNFVFFNDKIRQRTRIPERKFIGIHIRQGDNTRSIEHSPAVLFENRIREILEAEPGALFYLSTDSSELRDKFNHTFTGNIVVSGSGELNRNTLTGIEDAASDMIILSRSDYIIGSFYSSFSEVAALFNNIPLIILKK